MSLDNFSHDELKNMSMIELANYILIDENKAVNFRDVYEKISEIKGFSESQKQENISQFYTDLNVDGRFITLGSSMWGLKRWYPVDQAEEEVASAPKKKKLKKKKAAELEDDIADLDIVDDDLDDLVDGFDDELDDDDDFDDDFDEDLDEDLVDEDIDEDDEDVVDDLDDDVEEEKN